MSATVQAIFAFPLFSAIVGTAIQLGALEVGALSTTHATNEAARAASVILADDPRFYDGVSVGSPTGARLRDINDAVKSPLRVITSSPNVEVSVMNGTSSRAASGVFRTGDSVRVAVDFEFPCGVALGKWFVCGRRGTFHVRREAAMPYQGASYTYSR